MSIAVTTDTASDLSPAKAEALGVGLVPMPFMINDKNYLEGVDLDEAEFLRLTSGKNVEYHTSQPNIESVARVWDKALEDHDQVVHICLTEGLSSTVNTLRMLAESDRYRGRVWVPNACGVAPVQQWQVREALTMAERGLTAPEISRILERDRDKSSIFIGVSTLEYLRKGGRLKPAAYSVGTLLRIKPVLSIIDGGKLDVVAKVRTMKKVADVLVENLHQTVKDRWNDPEGRKCVFGVSYTGADASTADALVERLKQEFPNRLVEEIVYDPLSLLLSCHIGPDALGVGVWVPSPEAM
jgi:DegV family protein with EDD domain